MVGNYYALMVVIIIYGKLNNPARISVPIHSNQALKPGLLRHFLKVANLNENDL